MKPRINMIMLGVRDMEKAVRFHEKGPGQPRCPLMEPLHSSFADLDGHLWEAAWKPSFLARPEG